jgi:hypothetical protein
MFKADKIRGRNSFGAYACGIAAICDGKATSGSGGHRTVYQA